MPQDSFVKGISKTKNTDKTKQGTHKIKDTNLTQDDKVRSSDPKECEYLVRTWHPSRTQVKSEIFGLQIEFHELAYPLKRYKRHRLGEIGTLLNT